MMKPRRFLSTTRHVPMRPPDEIWITDSTFRDGQQAREPYTVQQIVDLYRLLHRLGGPKGPDQTERILPLQQEG